MPNLPNTAIDKIQIFSEVDQRRTQQIAAPRQQVMTMNIKLKDAAKKGYFMV
jgi:hypothetical protein